MASASLSTHILDTALGRPAAGVALVLEAQNGDAWHVVGRGITDADGRCRTLLQDANLEALVYRLRFEIAPWFTAQNLVPLYPYIEIVFRVSDPAQQLHIPLLCTANGFTTYRGS